MDLVEAQVGPSGYLVGRPLQRRGPRRRRAVHAAHLPARAAVRAGDRSPPELAAASRGADGTARRAVGARTCTPGTAEPGCRLHERRVDDRRGRRRAERAPPARRAPAADRARPADLDRRGGDVVARGARRRLVGVLRSRVGHPLLGPADAVARAPGGRTGGVPGGASDPDVRRGRLRRGLRRVRRGGPAGLPARRAAPQARVPVGVQRVARDEARDERGRARRPVEAAAVPDPRGGAGPRADRQGQGLVPAGRRRPGTTPTSTCASP